MTVEKFFVTASKNKYRYPSSAGYLTTEDLWDLPLTSKTKANLDDVAKGLNRELKANSEASFVVRAASSTRDQEQRLEIVKYVIDAKLMEREQARTRAANKLERDKLLAALDAQETKALADMSADEIRARLVELSS